MKMLARLFVFLCGLYVSAALAAYQPGAVVQVPTYAALAAGNYVNTPYLSITEAATGLGGGGDFTQQTCTPDGGVCISDNASHTFLRTIKTGSPVDLRWYGIADATSSGCLTNRASCDATTALNSAFTASAKYANGSVTTGQRSIVLYNSDVIMPSGVGLDCGGSPVTTPGQNAGTKFYWTLPSALVLNNAHSIITTSANSISNCLIFPAWYTTVPPNTYTGSPTATPASVHDMNEFSHLFTGTAVVQSGPNVILSNDVIWGYDICADASNSSGVINDNVTTECNNDWFIHNQRGGVEINSSQPSNFVQQRIKANGQAIDIVRWPVTAYADDGTGQIKLTLDNSFNTAICSTLSACLSAGQTMLISGFQEFNIQAHNTGDVTNGVAEIDNIPQAPGNGIDGIAAVQVGSTITDTGTAGCNFTGLTVIGIDIIAGTAFLSGPPTGCSPSSVTKEPLTFTSNSAGPAGGNGKFIIDSTTDSPNTITLRGSSYAGPTYTGTTWNSGTNVLKTYDITNIFQSQYVCSSGTAPFCTPPTAFTASTTTSSNINALGTGTGNVSVGDASTWPTTGLFLVADGGAGGCTEWIEYQRGVNADQSSYKSTVINVLARGIGGTTVCTHANGQTLTPSAPQVLSVVPIENAVIINATALSTESVGQAVQFANDNSVTSGLHAAAARNFNYLSWTANTYTAGGPFGPFTALATTNGSTLLTSVTNPTKAQPGMTISGPDIPATNTVSTTGTWSSQSNLVTLASTAGVFPGMSISGGNIAADSYILSLSGSVATISHRPSGAGNSVSLTISGVVVASVSGSTVTMNVSATGSHSGQKIAFAGCGYPAGQPWNGNCPSVDHQIGAINDKSAQGIVLDWPHGGRRVIEAQMFNAPAGVISKCVYGNGGGEGAQIDPTSVGIFITGSNTDGIRVANCKFAGVNNGIIINQSANQNDGTMFNNINVGAAILEFAVIGPGTNLTLEGIHGRAGPAYISDEGAQGTVISDSNMPGTAIYSDTTTGLSPSQVGCSANFLMINPCQNATGLALGAPTGGAIQGAVNTQTGAYKNGVEYSNITTSTFTPTGASTATTLPNFADRSLSILDFGAVPDSNCANDATSALSAAETAALAQGVHVIRFDFTAAGNCYKIGTHTVANGIRLWCPGPISGPPASNDFHTVPRIAESTTAGITFSTGSAETNCTFMQLALATNTPTGTFQDNYTRATSFTGTGLTISGDNVDIDGGVILGFNSDLTTKNSRLATMKNLYLDGNTCMTLANQGGGGTLIVDKINCAAFANKFGGMGVQEPSFPASSITDNGSGVLQVHLTTPCVGTGCVLNGYKVWLNGGSNASVQSAQGGWTAANVTSTTVDLQGSSSNFIAGQTESATTTLGSVVVSGISTNISQVQPTQAVSGTCVSGGTTVAAVERAYGVIWLSAPATSTGACTITITDSAPTTVSISTISIGNSGGTGYAQGDIISPATGTGTAATFSVDQVDNGVIGGPGVVTMISIIDGGLYSVAPSPLINAATTGGSGTGLTLNLSVGASLYGSAYVRNGAAYSISKAAGVQMSNISELSHAQGITFGFNGHSANIVNCSLHDENVLQDATHIGINFTSNSNANVLTNCNSFYFGIAVALHNSAPAQLGNNVIQSSLLGGSSGNSGLQNTILDVASYDSGGNPQPGVNSKSGISLQDNASQVFGTMTIMGDAREVDLSGNGMSSTILYCQNDVAATTITGTNFFKAGSPNCPTFAPGPESNSIKVQPTTTTTLLLTNQNCGNTILSGVAGGTLPVILPVSPVTGCEITFRPNTNAITIDPNGATIATNTTAQSSPLTLPAEINGSILFRYDPSTARWRIASGAPSTVTGTGVLFGQTLAHGQVYLSCRGGCSGGTGQLQVCPYNGPGGLMISGALFSIPSCLYLDNSVFSAVTSALRYIYALTTTQGVTSMADNGSGKIRLTLASTAGFNTSDPITCVNATGSTAANVLNDVSTTLVDATHIDINDASFVATGTATCHWVGLVISAAGHATDTNGVEIQSGNSARTLVGMVWVDGSHNLIDLPATRWVASWFNRQPKKAIASLGTGTATTTSTTFKTPTTTAIEASFLVWGPPATPGTLPMPSVPWSISAGASASGLASTAQIGVCFGQNSLGTNASCSGAVETEIASETQAVATDVQNYSISGQTTTVAEGRNFGDLVANVSTGTLTLAPSASASPSIVNLDVFVQE